MEHSAVENGVDGTGRTGAGAAAVAAATIVTAQQVEDGHALVLEDIQANPAQLIDVWVVDCGNSDSKRGQRGDIAYSGTVKRRSGNGDRMAAGAQAAAAAAAAEPAGRESGHCSSALLHHAKLANS